MTSPLTVCEWYALCDHAAVGTTFHPALGPVPICRRCADKHDLTMTPYTGDWEQGLNPTASGMADHLAAKRHSQQLALDRAALVAAPLGSRVVRTSADGSWVLAWVKVSERDALPGIAASHGWRREDGLGQTIGSAFLVTLCRKAGAYARLETP